MAHRGNPNIAQYAPKKGETRNPSGIGGEQTAFRHEFMRDLRKEWQRRGPAALQELSPIDLVRAAAAALPKESQPERPRDPADLARAVFDTHAFLAAVFEGRAVRTLEVVGEERPLLPVEVPPAP